jgi:hypothetical protein
MQKLSKLTSDDDRRDIGLIDKRQFFAYVPTTKVEYEITNTLPLILALKIDEILRYKSNKICAKSI